MKIHLVMMTFNRIEYTQKSLPALLADPTEDFVLTLWDNGSTDGTSDYVKSVEDSRIVEKVFCVENKRQTFVTNKIWSETSADLVGKVDNDCVVTPGWTHTLAQAHRDIAELGVVGCWHFAEDDFNYQKAARKIVTLGAHRIFRHPWIDGSALLVKRAVFLKYAPVREDEYLSKFWLRLAAAGYVNGFYYPLIYQEHLDDPKNEHCLIKDDASFEKYRHISFGLGTGCYHDVAGRMKNRNEIVENLLEDPYDPRYYLGWRAKMRSLRRRGVRWANKLRAR